MDNPLDKSASQPCGLSAAPATISGFDSDNGLQKSKTGTSFIADDDVRRIIITGDVQSGKSTLAALLVQHLKHKNIRAAGIIARGLWKDDKRDGFDIVDLSTGQTTPLARRIPRTDMRNISQTPFKFLETGVATGRKALSLEQCTHAGLILVDEIGKLEVRRLGWAPCLAPLLALSQTVHVWIVREHLVKEIRRIWQVAKTEVIHVTDPDALQKLITACVKES
jgi:nucleoside-triphosphatase THEP1